MPRCRRLRVLAHTSYLYVSDGVWQGVLEQTRAHLVHRLRGAAVELRSEEGGLRGRLFRGSRGRVWVEEGTAVYPDLLYQARVGLGLQTEEEERGVHWNKYLPGLYVGGTPCADGKADVLVRRGEGVGYGERIRG